MGTAKLALALAVTTALAAGIGSLLGLPLPGRAQGGDDGTLASSALSPLLDLGTAPLSSDGPFFPVVGPVDYGERAAGFGSGRAHPGQDLFAKIGTPLVAVRSGTIVDGGATKGRYSGGRGNYVYLWSPEDKRTYVYLHLVKPSPLQIGEQVVAGQFVGGLGCTGSCDGAHLHFEVRLGFDDLRHDPKPIDPEPLIRGWAHAPPPPS